MRIKLSFDARSRMDGKQNIKFSDLKEGDIFYLPNIDGHAYMKIAVADDKCNTLDLTYRSYWQVGNEAPVVKREIVMLVGFKGE